MLRPEALEEIDLEDKEYFEKEEKFFHMARNINREDRDEG